MKKYYLLLCASLFSLTFTSCNDDDDKNPRDPEGTVVQNVTSTSHCYLTIPVEAKSEYAPEEVKTSFFWQIPDDIIMGRTNDVEVKVGNYYYQIRCEAKICSVGKVSGLGAVRKVPAGTWVERLACEEQSGYVVRVEYYTYYKFQSGIDGSEARVEPGDQDYYKGAAYARFYVEEHLEDGKDQNTGMKIKIQYPFKP